MQILIGHFIEVASRSYLNKGQNSSASMIIETFIIIAVLLFQTSLNKDTTFRYLFEKVMYPRLSLLAIHDILCMNVCGFHLFKQYLLKLHVLP